MSYFYKEKDDQTGVVSIALASLIQRQVLRAFQPLKE